VQHYDYSRLLGKMREKGFTQERLAKCISISECSLNLTLNNKRDFRQDEMIKIGEALDIPLNEFNSYFFAHKL